MKGSAYVWAMAGMLDFRSPEFIENPYPTYALLRDERPFWFEPHSRHVYISRYADIKAVLLNERFVSDRTDERLGRLPAGTSSTCLRRVLHDRLMMTDGEEHRSVRRQVSWAFTAARVRTYRDAHHAAPGANAVDSSSDMPPAATAMFSDLARRYLVLIVEGGRVCSNTVTGMP